MNTTISQKRVAQGAGHQSAKDANGSESYGCGNCGGKGNSSVYAAVRAEAMAAAATTPMTAAETLVEAAAMITVEAAMVVAMAAANSTAMAAAMAVAAVMAKARDGRVEENCVADAAAAAVTPALTTAVKAAAR